MPRRSKKPVRDGRVYVVARHCATCIFKPGNLMHLNDGTVEMMVRSATKRQGCIPCHTTLDGYQAICRGFYELRNTMEYSHQLLQIAERLGYIEFVEPPPKEAKV